MSTSPQADRHVAPALGWWVGGRTRVATEDAMTAALAHRGPDSCGVRLDGPVAFGHRRLAVIDPTPAADQPMVGADDAVWLVFNGEIYDFQTLRRELERAGHGFRTRCDTEVILEAYLAWGDDFIDRLDGMFAIAIWDGRDRKLRLYRDRPGIKPLYWTFDGRVFAFASELKAIERLDAGLDTGLDLQVDPTAVWTLPPRETAIAGVDALTHAVEAFVSRRASPLSDAMAREAFARIVPHLPHAVHGEGEDRREALSQLSTGRLCAGLAYGNAGTIAYDFLLAAASDEIG